MKLVRNLTKSEIAPVKVFTKAEIAEHKERIMKEYETLVRRDQKIKETPRPLMVH